jgi:ADP-L-glycero-D-manno-heptose 6-epimerase
MTHALVTGSSGFIGHQLVNSLTTIGMGIGEIDEEYFSAPDWKVALVNKLDHFNPKTVFHVGACSDTLKQDVQFMMTRNYESTKIIADWCVLNKRELIYSSSAANYGEAGRYPSNLYGWSKYAAEDYVVKSGGVALRYFNVYGPGEESKGNMASFLYQAYLMNKHSQEVFLFPGKPLRDFIYIKDVISANIHASECYKLLSGKYFEVSTGVASSFEEMLEIFGLEYKYSSDKLIPNGYQFLTRGDRSKWMKGWLPNFSLQQGVIEYREYLEKNENL